MLKIESPNRYTSPKIITLKHVAGMVKKAKTAGKTVGLCHGGFDLLHPGHITHFESAKKLCNVLVVSVTSDRYVAKRKGDGRPVFPEQLRAYAVASLTSVDYVVITDAAGGVDVISGLKPSLYIKGPDFIGKKTPGIEAEREAIAAVGGRMVYTRDPKLSATEIISYIRYKISRKRLLVISDRDGTMIDEADFLGKDAGWKRQVNLKKAVISFLSWLANKYEMTIIGVTNQSGVARGYFPETRVRQIHRHIDILLKPFNIKVSSWQYDPTVEREYAAARPQISWNKSYVKEKTVRKPSAAMVDRALDELKKNQSDFDKVIVLGDREDDRKLAENLQVLFLDVGGKTYDDLVAEFEKINT